MTHGRPDFTSSINITGQDLGEIVSRPKYGAANSASYSDTITEPSYDILCEITGTGMIYAGFIKHLGAFDPSKVSVAIGIDGMLIAAGYISALNDNQIEDESMGLIFEQYYSEEFDKYIQGLTRGTTFEENFYIKIINFLGSGASDVVHAQVWYALI